MTKARRTLAILNQVDQLMTGWSCPRSTECCKFSVTGREPWLSEAEWSLIRDELARRGQAVPVPRADGVCPFLTAGSCSIYAVRPLGCRAFYCERSTPGTRPSPEAMDALAPALLAESRPEAGRPRELRVWLRIQRLWDVTEQESLDQSTGPEKLSDTK